MIRLTDDQRPIVARLGRGERLIGPVAQIRITSTGRECVTRAWGFENAGPVHASAVEALIARRIVGARDQADGTRRAVLLINPATGEA